MRENVKTKLKELGVSIIYLFGSRAGGTSTPMSDMDIGVVLKGEMTLYDSRTLYNDLYDLLSGLYPLVELDIVFLQSAPLTLQYHAIREGKVLYEENPQLTADYEAYVISMYLDFKPVLEYFDAISSARYSHA
ncbi:MAG TPA: nucleotidyltransferase domain-containing protein [Syntrophales bacterium]|nr:nucleotidyltransferase domain-containing protein [Syntrophales bacterium]HLE41010.1 nucleotidyltransferase domain-containing protein [Nitrospirota bacterium]